MVDEQEYDDDAGEPRDADGDPGGLPGGRIPAPPIPRDEWVSQVVDDPSSGTQPVLLQGYVGDAADESRTRIYLDASLGTYVDVANDDVLHHQPLKGEHEPSGGTMVWVRGDAQVSPGTGGGAAAAGGDFFTGPVLEQNRQAGMGGAAQPAAQVHITLLTVAGCVTRWFICPPQRTLATLCTHQIICSRVCQDPLGGIGPLGTVHQQQGFRAQAPVGGDMTRMPCSAVDACPTSLGCTSFQGCEPGPVVGPTGWQGCGQPPIMTLPGCAHGPATNFQGCGQPHISLPGCIHTGTCPQAEAQNGPIGPTGWQGCGQPTHMIGCTGYQGCGQPHISLPGCIQTGTCGAEQAAGPIGPTGWQHCGHTLAKICTFHCPPPLTLGSPCGPGPVSMHPGCPSPQIGAEQAAGPIGQTGWLHCGHTLATVCTFHCPPPLTLGSPCGPGPVSMHPGCPSPQIGAEQAAGPIGPTGWQGCGHPLPQTWFATCGIPPVSMNPGCPPPQLGAAGGGLIGQTGWQGCGQPHISLPGCVHTGTCPQADAVTGPGSTIATVCTQIGCPPHTQNCTNATVCTHIGCPPHAARGAEQGAAGVATGQYAPQCPTFGFTCTYVHCPPMAIETRGLSCPTLGFTCTYVHCPPRAATVVTQGLGCPQSVSCPPETIVTWGYGCPPTSTCPPVSGHGCPPETIVTWGYGCPPTSTCPPDTIATRGLGCPQSISCPPETLVTRGFGCPPTSTCPPTGGFGCPRTSTCPPTYAPGCGGGGLRAEAAAAGPYTYQPGCHTFGFTCTQFC